MHLGSSYSICRQCCDATVTIANRKVLLLGHAVLESISATRCFWWPGACLYLQLSACIAFSSLNRLFPMRVAWCVNFVNIQQLQLYCWLIAVLPTLYYTVVTVLFVYSVIEGFKLQLNTWGSLSCSLGSHSLECLHKWSTSHHCKHQSFWP